MRYGHVMSLAKDSYPVTDRMVICDCKCGVTQALADTIRNEQAMQTTYGCRVCGAPIAKIHIVRDDYWMITNLQSVYVLPKYVPDETDESDIDPEEASG